VVAPVSKLDPLQGGITRVSLANQATTTHVNGSESHDSHQPFPSALAHVRIPGQSSLLFLSLSRYVSSLTSPPLAIYTITTPLHSCMHPTTPTTTTTFHPPHTTTGRQVGSARLAVTPSGLQWRATKDTTMPQLLLPPPIRARLS
jgi:hypothetical protein